MRILHLSATNILATQNGEAEMKRRAQIMEELAASGTQVDYHPNPEGPLSIQSEEDEKNAVPGLLKGLRHSAGYDAVTIGCFGDPGLSEIRQAANVPVLGPGISAIYAASLLADRFSILSPVDSSVPSTLSQVERYGFLGRLASVKPLNIPVLTIRQDRDLVVGIAAQVGRECVEADGAEAVILGCMSLAFQRIDLELGETLRVPVINPVITLVRMAEMLAMTSRGAVIPG